MPSREELISVALELGLTEDEAELEVDDFEEEIAEDTGGDTLSEIIEQNATAHGIDY